MPSLFNYLFFSSPTSSRLNLPEDVTFDGDVFTPKSGVKTPPYGAHLYKMSTPIIKNGTP